MGSNVEGPEPAPSSNETAAEETAAPSWWSANDAGGLRADTTVSPSHYQILGEHGRGGLGRVLRAKDLRTGRVVVIKEILRDAPHAVTRFCREALVTANLQHPAIVPVYEVGRWPDGQPFYTMKLVDGIPLSDAIRAADTVDARMALLPHVVQVAEALAYAHARGWIHRDLKPSNVLVGAYGETVVIDWGLAKHVGDGVSDVPDIEASDVDSSLTLAGQVVGTPLYMPPEQARGEEIEPRSDVYAVGALLYHVLAGVPPYDGVGSPKDVLAAVIAGPPRTLTDVAPDIPTELNAIVSRAMAYRSVDRYANARELAKDLARFRAGSLVAAHDYRIGELIGRWIRRHRTVVGVAAVATIAVAVIGVVSVRENTRARDHAEQEQARATLAETRANERRREAELRVATLHTELGLRELMAGAPARALAYLADAYAKAPGDNLVAFLLARALESQNRLEVATTTGIVDGFSFGGDRVLVRSPAPAPVIDLARREKAMEARAFGVLAPDGTWMVTDTGDGIAAIDLATGAPLARRAGDPDRKPVRWADIASSGRVTTVDERGQWIASDRDLRALETLQIPFAPIDVMFRGEQTIAVGGGGEIWIARVGSRSNGLVASPHTDRISGVCGSADGSVWMTMDRHVTVVWRGRQVVAREAHHGLAGGCAIDGAGTIAVTSVDGAGVFVMDLQAPKPSRGRLLRASRGEVPNNRDTPTMSTDGTLIAVGDHLGFVELFDAKTLVPIARTLGHDAPSERLAFSPDGRRLVTATVGGDVRIWSTEPSSSYVSIDLGARGYGGAFVSGDRAVVSGSAGTRIVGMDGRTVRELVGHTGEVTASDVGGGLVATASHDKTARLWTSDGEPIAVLPGGGDDRVSRVNLSRDGKRALTATLDGVVTLWRADGSRERQLTERSALFTARLSPDGARVMTLEDGSARGTLWDATTGQRIADIIADGSQAVDARFSPDASLVAVPAAGTSLVVFDGRTGERRFDVAHEGPAIATAWSSDGMQLATSDMAGTIHLSHRDGTLVRSIRVERAVTGLAFFPDGQMLAVATEDGIVRIHEIARGRELTRRARPAFANTLVVSRDGTHLLLPGGPGMPPSLWKLDRYSGSVDELATKLRCAVPYRLDETSGLVRNKVGGRECPTAM